MKESSIASGLIVGGIGILIFMVVSSLLLLSGILSNLARAALFEFLVSLAFAIFGMLLMSRSLKSQGYARPSVAVAGGSLLILFIFLAAILLAVSSTLGP